MIAVPVGQVCAQLGLTDARELFGGHQSTVLRVEFAGSPVVLKLIDAVGVEPQLLDTRVAMVLRLAALSDAVCAPVAIRDRFVHEFNFADSPGCYGICYEFADGVSPDVGDPDDAALMGRELGRLHRYMAQLPAVDLPVMTGFADTSAEEHRQCGPPQLLHGDFNSANVRLTPGRPRIFDFDDSGYGPVEFDLAQALYVELFDAGGRRNGRYASFRRNFLNAYTESSRAEWSADSLDTLITKRVRALEGWLDDLSHAPAGIRNSSAEWHKRLRAFVNDYDSSDKSSL